MNLAEARAVVTGGASGLGYATAEKVVAAGGMVAIFDLNEEQGAAAVDKLGERATFIKTDVADEDNVKSSIAKAQGFMGTITLAVNSYAPTAPWVATKTVWSASGANPPVPERVV